MSKPNRRPTKAGTSGSTRPAADPISLESPAPSSGDPRPGSGSRTSTSASGSRRAGRRETARRRAARGTFLERNRRRIVTGVAVLAAVLVGGWVFATASQPAYACSSIFPAEAAAPSGHLGAVQRDLGNRHVNPGDHVRYTECPPASGSHINVPGTLGPIPAVYYGPNDRALPQGWVHNLEHGGVVVLYSCSLGACDEPDLVALRDFYRGWDAVSPICKVPPRQVGPVVARFDEMAKPYAALLWDRVLYMDELDPELIKRFYLEEGELVSDDGEGFLVPPEPCALPSPSPSASPSTSASPSVSPGVSPSASPSGSASPSSSASPGISPSASLSPSPSAS